MSVKDLDISKLITWLGRDGAIAGLNKSDIADSDLRHIAESNGLNIHNKNRKDIATGLVNKSLDIKRLIERYGRDETICRLEDSSITIADLRDIATRNGLSIEKKQNRSDLISDIINHDVSRIDKSPNQLMDMEYGDLKKYFEERNVSRTELVKIIQEIGIFLDPGSSAHLADYAAREISSFGMYARIAKGVRGKRGTSPRTEF